MTTRASLVAGASRLLAFATVALLFCSGCRGPRFPLPFTAAQMARVNTGAALSWYLGQPDATAEVCDPGSRGPHVEHLTDKDYGALTDGLIDHRVDAALWTRCAKTLLEEIPRGEAASFLDAMGKAYRTLARSDKLDKDEGEHAELELLHQIFLLRPNGLSPHAELMADLTADLRQAVARHRIGPLATRYGEDLLATLDLEKGLWKGKRVDVAALDELQQQKDEAMLKRFAARLSDPGLQTEAKRRLVRLRILASELKEVQEHAKEVEETVLASGRNAVPLAQHAPVKGWLDTAKMTVRGVLARQDVWKQQVTMLAYGGDRPGLSVMPGLDLRGVMLIQLAGVAKPVSLCAPPDALDVTPCVLPADVVLKNPLAYLDKDGQFHFVEHIRSTDAIALVHDTPNLSLPVELAGKPLLTLVWPMRFERPANLIFEGQTGGRAPDLRIRVEQRDPQRMVIATTAGSGTLLAAVELDDAEGYSVVSRGGAGATGASGSDGHPGTDGASGSSASCSGGSGTNGGNGSDGTSGGPGGPGGPGGAGGDVHVQVACTAGDCQRTMRLLERMVRSEGGAPGAGGSGGHGGQGGRGGSGGSSASCSNGNGGTYTVSGGSPGMNGRSGNNGSDGPPGPAGPPGHVDITAVR